MGTFFARGAVCALLLAACSHKPASSGIGAAPAPRPDTVVITVPVIRLTTDATNGSATIDSATLALLERQVMSRVASLLRAQVRAAAGAPSAGQATVQYAAPAIQHGLLGTITFNEDGSLPAAARDRIAAIAKMLGSIAGPLEIRARSDVGTKQMDIAIARARRVYVELLGASQDLAERSVTINVSAAQRLTAADPQVEIFWRQVP